MSHSRFFPAVITAMLFTLAGNAGAQSASSSGSSIQKGSEAAAETAKTTLRIQFVISRFEGEKKLGSLPYTAVVTTGPSGGSGAHIRMGIEVPVPVATTPQGSKEGATIQYHNVGTNIDCSNIRDLGGGRYQFDARIENSAAAPGDSKLPQPLFRRFDTGFTAVLRDGQSMQTIASADPVTGEVLKIDVTLSVVR
jgi:hypothetical protein